MIKIDWPVVLYKTAFSIFCVIYAPVVIFCLVAALLALWLAPVGLALAPFWLYENYGPWAAAVPPLIYLVAIFLWHMWKSPNLR
jgi:hypothetical protein